MADRGKEVEEGVARFLELVKAKPVDKTSLNMSGFLEQIMWWDFKKIPYKHGLYGFINGETCAACSEYLKKLKDLGGLKAQMTLVFLMKEHMQEVLSSDGVTVPFTRIYNGGEEPIWEKQGILYATQLESLFAAWKTIDAGGKFHTMSEFDVFKAKTRVKEVQAFRANDYLNLDLAGRKVIAREGQFVVFWPDTNSFEVLNPEDFENRFE